MLIGIVGKPSAGKSTFFRASTLSEVEIANYPFTTIKPNHAIGFVRIPCVDTFFNTQCTPRTGSCQNHQRFVPVELLDVAGLVPGAHRGEGMGLQFMNDLNMADVLIHIIDISGSIDAHGKPVDPLSYDPLKDVAFLEEELDYWYLSIIKRGWDRFSRQVQMEKKDPTPSIAKQLSGLKVTEDMISLAIKNLNLDAPLPQWSEDELFAFARNLRQQSKPVLIAANKIDIPGAQENLERLKKEYPDYHVVACSAAAELALKEATKQEKITYLPGDAQFDITGDLTPEQKKGLDTITKTILGPFGSTGVQETLNHAVFQLLKYKAIYPGGVTKLQDREGRILPDCFLLPEKATALDFAYRLHTDFGDNFIKAINVKTKMPVGRDHVLEDGDVIEIMAKK